MSDANAPAGWYPVAEGSAQLRYWDGTQWTEHIHDPSAAAAQAAQVAAAQAQAAQQEAYAGQQQWQERTAYGVPAQPKAPEGTQPNTVMGWLNAATPVLLLVDVIPLYAWISNLLGGIDVNDPNSTNALIAREFTPTYAVVLLLAFVAQALFVVFAALDWRTLRRNGVPAPFHWAWSFFTLVSFGGLVYVIGRAVVVKRRTDRSGYGPMILYIVLMAAYLIAAIVVGAVLISSLQSQFVDQLNSTGGAA
ncbi:MAG TPA: DUF2510 domain-containing protein [Galbitalea sp.]|jgi:hypothetical protein